MPGFTIDTSFNHEIVSEVCTFCKHVIDAGYGRKCKAFPDGIPDEIWDEKNDHKRPYPGDRGIQWEEFTGDDDAPVDNQKR